jgi:NAD(P)-dependent dehydrogenase (short-subunit alcohol dehydrogenase family)
MATKTGQRRAVLGAALARRFAIAGYDVGVNYLDDPAAAKSVAADVEAAGARAHLVQCDIADVGALEAMVVGTATAFGRLDVLVNNAAIFPRSDFLDLDVGEWTQVLDVNLRATVFGSKYAARTMAKSGGGSIICLASQAVRGVRRSVPYVASKGAIVALTRALALELAPHRIRVNSISPGLIDTDQPRIAHSEAELAERAAQIPWMRLGTPDDIARAAVFLASPEADYITGQTLHVNGGSFMP